MIGCRFAAVLALAMALGIAGCLTYTPTGGSPDAGGRRLVVFASDRDQPAGQYDLYLWDADSLDLRRMPGLNVGASEHHPSITNDGRFVTFQSDRGLGSSDDIYLYDRLNSKFVSLPDLNTAEPESEPCFTGDGLKLAFVQGSSVRRIRLYDGMAKQFIPLPGLDASGVWYSDYSPSPNRDGSVIAFVSNRNGTPDVFLYDRGLRRVLDAPKLAPLCSAGNDVDPCLTPSGRYLVFSSDRAGGSGGGSYDLYVMEFAPSIYNRDTTMAEVAAANSAFDERGAAIGENGYVIVFQSNRPGPGRWDLWSFDRSSGQVALPPGCSSGADDIEPAIRWPY